MSFTARARVLIVNHNASLCDNIMRLLNEEGITQIDIALSGQEAIQALKKHTYDIVITDIEIGSMDAWQLTRLIRSGILNTPADTGIIALSSTYSERIAEATAKTFEIDRFLPVDRLQSIGSTAKSIIDPSNRHRHRTSVLVIEDYDDTAELIDRILKQRFHIERASDGEAGLHKWMEGQHDIVLLDLMLPKMTGEEVLTEILKSKPNQSVIIMTAHGDAEKAGELIEKGAVDFIAKPFKAEQLRHVCNIAAQREDFIISNDQFKAKQNALTEARGSAQVTLESIADGVITTDREGKIGYMNPVAQAILGWTLEEVIHKPIQHYFKTYHRVSRIPTASFVKRVLVEETAIRSTTTSILRNRNDEELIIDQQAAPIKDHCGITTGAVLIFHDQTEAQHLEQQLSFHANHDPVTGLQVRSMFDQELRLAIHECNQEDSTHALCQLDILQFKMINDTCGRHAGDKLLQKIARILKNKVKAPSDMITRLGGDEFGFLLRHCPVESAQQICEIICQEISSQAFEWENKRFEVNVGIGIAPISSACHELSDVVYAAGTACNMAKERGKNHVQIYSDKDDVIIEKRSEILLATELMDALKEDKLCLFQQKILNVDENGKDSFEVLLRIIDKEGKLKTPAPYLNAAERYKLTPNIDRWVFTHALQWLEENPNVANSIDHLTVNLSGLSICDENFSHFIHQALKEANIEPEKICFEITETAAVSNYIRACEFISTVKALGCKFALDDFGSGMSSFAYLKKLPVDLLKIDGMFVKDILEDPIDCAMVKSINEIGQVMGLKTIAEFVENEEIARSLKEIGVDFLQGYGIAKPEPLEKLKSLSSIQKTA